MLVLTLLIAALTALFATLAGRSTQEPLERVTVALLLATLAPIYAPS